MRVVLILITCFLFFSCTNKKNKNQELNEKNETTTINKTESLPADEYVKWVKDAAHGLKQEKTIGDIIFATQYKPIEYMICLEERSTHIADSTIKRKISELGDMQYIDLKIELKNGQGELLKYGLGSPSEYEARVNYFSFRMQNDIYLVDGKDTLPCSLFHFERAYDVAPYSTFVLGFPAKKNTAGDKTLVYHDTVFRKGIIKLRFESQDINALPQLQTE